LTASIPEALPQAQQQFCTWHAVESMVTKLRQIGHPKELFLPRKDDQGKDLPTFREHCWNYVFAGTVAPGDLTTNRETAGEAGGPKFKDYLDKEWQPKERKTMTIYTRKYANLGATSSQMGESYHNVMKEITNAQLSLEDATKRLASKVLSI